MKKIASFCVDHTKLKKGLYLSRIDGDVVTYDLRMCTPNAGKYLENAALHSFEHLLATYTRNSAYGGQVVYAGPMGCRTGFYFLVRDAVKPKEVIRLLRDACAYIAGYEGEIPGAAREECGNCRDHDPAGAKVIAREYGEVIADWTPEKLRYEN